MWARPERPAVTSRLLGDRDLGRRVATAAVGAVLVVAAVFVLPVEGVVALAGVAALGGACAAELRVRVGDLAAGVDEREGASTGS